MTRHRNLQDQPSVSTEDSKHSLKNTVSRIAGSSWESDITDAEVTVRTAEITDRTFIISASNQVLKYRL